MFGGVLNMCNAEVCLRVHAGQALDRHSSIVEKRFVALMQAALVQN